MAARMPKRSEEMLRDLLLTVLLLFWITCVSSSPIASHSRGTQTGGSTAAAGAVVASGPGIEGQRLLSRAKRGWVWNQMFVLEEFSGPDPILVGRLHTDLDVGNKNIKALSSVRARDVCSGYPGYPSDRHGRRRLWLRQQRQTRLQHSGRPTVLLCGPQLRDHKDCPPRDGPGDERRVPSGDPGEGYGRHMGGLSGTTTVTVTLTDINDNPPKFSKSLYEFVIPEDLPLGKTGGKVRANDRDIGENAKSTYNIIDGDGLGIFEIVTDAQTQEGFSASESRWITRPDTPTLSK
ncbi:hypothetical protein WMY93_020056 [Mugilogobius chulae]|uniref:Cadherin domain-containing protein n=1 Tax=Mugilogobius chulae TaxID=88201 RepID=A0AAW0NH32_9GOBI